MGRSRTITVLVVLLAAMTVGAMTLMLLETSPLRPPIPHAAMQTAGAGPAGAILKTDVPLQPIKWQNIIIHGSQAERPGVDEQSHFVIDPTGGVEVSPLWKRQAEGNHVAIRGRDWSLDSVGICLTGDLTNSAPSAGQYRALLILVGTLQQYFNISADHVYLYRHLDARTRSPGRKFPAADFAAHLLRP